MPNLNIRIDSDLKSQAEMIFTDLGMTMTTAINVFLKQVIRCNGIPFSLQADPFYSSENQRRLLISKQRMEQTKEPKLRNGMLDGMLGVNALKLI